MKLVLMYIMGIVLGIVVSDDELDFKGDLSAENNFFRFKKAINHALPGQSFFRINFNSPHPDHGKGKLLRPIGHEVIKSNTWTPIPKSKSKKSQVKSRVVPSTTASYKPKIETSSVEVSHKSQPTKYNNYESSSSEKG